jgi:hypothetical protein
MSNFLKKFFVIIFLFVVHHIDAQYSSMSQSLSSSTSGNSFISNSGQVATGVSSDSTGNLLLRGFLYQAADAFDQLSDNNPPSVFLTHSDQDNYVKNSDVVTITAIFTESMADTPTISLTGIVDNIELTPDTFDFNDYWRLNFVLNGQADEPNDSGGENFAYMSLVRTDRIQQGEIVFVDCRSADESLAWMIQSQRGVDFENSNEYQLVGSFGFKDYYISNSASNNFENIVSVVDQSSEVDLLTIDSQAEYDYLVSLFESSSTLEQNEPFIIGLIQDTSDENYSEPSGGWKWKNSVHDSYNYILNHSLA